MLSTTHVVEDVVPYLIVADARAALSFYVVGLGAVEDHRLTMPDGKVGHAEVRFGDRRVFVADELPNEGQIAPQPGSSFTGRSGAAGR